MKILKSLFAPTRTWKNLFRKPYTIDKKDIFDQPREAANRYRGFHINDWEKCVGCGSCGEICPTDAIEMYEIKDLEYTIGHKPERPAIDYGRCSFCGLCVDICTSDSLKMSKEYLHLSTDYQTFKFIPQENGIHDIEFDIGYSRDEISELLDLERYEIDEIPHEGRIDSFIEIIKGFSKEMALAEASRCVECGVCTETCPANMNIPEYIKSIWNNDLDEGLDYLYKTNPLSNACGRVCTHICEDACVIANRGKPIAIRWLKRYIVDNSPDEQYEKVVMDNVSKQNNGKIAIVGSGPGGLSAGYYLRTLGYEVDIYDEKELPGGVIRYGVPSYRFPDEALDQDLKFIKKIGVNFIMNKKIGKDIALETLHDKYDAVYVSTGHWVPKKLNIENLDHKDVHFSNEFLQQSREYLRNNSEMPDITENSIVIGGGDVSFDIARTLLRFQKEKYGHHHVQFIARKDKENLAASEDEIIEGKQEGMIYNLERSPLKIIVDSETNKIKGVETQVCKTIIDDEGKAHTNYIEGETEFIKGDRVYFSIGSTTEFEFLSDELLENLDIEKNILNVKENNQVDGYPWLFAGGDLIGGKDVITAVADGHNAAKGIDEFLNSK